MWIVVRERVSAEEAPQMLVRNDESYSTLDDDTRRQFRRAPTRDLGLTSGGATSLRSFWLIVRWRAWLIAAVTVATVILVGSALVVMPPRYKATTVVLVDPRQPRVTTTEALCGYRSGCGGGREPGRAHRIRRHWPRRSSLD